MTLSAAEQYLLELMNRARLDPAGETARMGIDLNSGVAAGTISTAAKQVLAPNTLLETAATNHTLWMLQMDVFSHTGVNNTRPDQRVTAAGYVWSSMGENIAFTGTTGTINVQTAIEELNTNLFLSVGHRLNLMNATYREVGLGAETGVFTQAGVNYNAEMLTEDFATSGTARFLTGVAYADASRDKFYSMGEGTAGVVFAAAGQSATSAAAGGYSLALGSNSTTAVTGRQGTLNFALTVDMSAGNVKLDLVDAKTFYTSGSLVLGSGVNNVVLLGVAELNASGNAVANTIAGNSGANTLSGGGGNDNVLGNAGADVLHGNSGNDKLVGGTGADSMFGETGKDILTGGADADVFVFSKGGGVDRITDFSVADKDVLQLDDAIWTGQILTAATVVSQFATVGVGEVLIDFGNGQQIHLTGLATLTGLAAEIVIF